MKIFITGCCGFIGFNFANFLAKSNKKIRIIGIDNLNDHYSVNLKRKRLKELNKNKNFIFYKIDINQYEKLKELYKKYLFNYVFHFAAQAGVRYSLINPKAYIENNVSGFFNILNPCFFATEIAFVLSISKVLFSEFSFSNPLLLNLS